MLAAKLWAALTRFENNTVVQGSVCARPLISLTVGVLLLQADQSAGGVYSSQSVLSVSDCRFIGNHASISAGGIFFDAGSTGVFTSSNDLFERNSARVGNGGAFYVVSLPIDRASPHASFSNSLFVENLSGFAKGGAIFGMTSKLVLDTCTFHRNTVSASRHSIAAAASHSQSCEARMQNSAPLLLHAHSDRGVRCACDLSRVRRCW